MVGVGLEVRPDERGGIQNQFCKLFSEHSVSLREAENF